MARCQDVKTARWLVVFRTIYVNVDSPNLGFPYFNFLGLAHAVPWWNSDMIKLVKYCQKLIKDGIIGQKLPNVAKSYQMLPNVAKCCQKFPNIGKKCCQMLLAHLKRNFQFSIPKSLFQLCSPIEAARNGETRPIFTTTTKSMFLGPILAYMSSPSIIIISHVIPILTLIWGSEKVWEIPILFFILTTFQLKMDCRYINN